MELGLKTSLVWFPQTNSCLYLPCYTLISGLWKPFSEAHVRPRALGQQLRSSCRALWSKGLCCPGAVAVGTVAPKREGGKGDRDLEYSNCNWFFRWFQTLHGWRRGWELSQLSDLNVCHCIPRWGNMSPKRSYQRKPLHGSCWTEAERGCWAPSTSGSLTCWPTWNPFRTKSRIGWTPLRRSWMVGLLPGSLPVGRHCELIRMSCDLAFQGQLCSCLLFFSVSLTFIPQDGPALL